MVLSNTQNITHFEFTLISFKPCVCRVRCRNLVTLPVPWRCVSPPHSMVARTANYCQASVNISSPDISSPDIPPGNTDSLEALAAWDTDNLGPCCMRYYFGTDIIRQQLLSSSSKCQILSQIELAVVHVSMIVAICWHKNVKWNVALILWGFGSPRKPAVFQCGWRPWWSDQC